MIVIRYLAPQPRIKNDAAYSGQEASEAAVAVAYHVELHTELVGLCHVVAEYNVLHIMICKEGQQLVAAAIQCISYLAAYGAAWQSAELRVRLGECIAAKEAACHQETDVYEFHQ